MTYTPSFQEKVTITAQLPGPLVDELRSIARAEGRSLASQIRIFLADAVIQKTTAENQAARAA